MHSIEWCLFQWPWVTSDPDFKVTTFLKSNIGKAALLKDKFTIAQEETIPNIWNGTMFGDLDWPLNASCRFVSISSASCFIVLLLTMATFCVLLVYVAMCSVFWIFWLSCQYLPSDWLEIILWGSLTMTRGLCPQSPGRRVLMIILVSCTVWLFYDVFILLRNNIACLCWKCR